MLEWLKIHRYRDVAPGTELTFHEGHNVILGPNGGGKTTLLNIISAIVRGSLSSLAGEDFHIEFKLSSRGSFISASVNHTQKVSGEEDVVANVLWDDRLEAVLGMPDGRKETVRVANGVVENVETDIQINPLARALYRKLMIAAYGSPFPDWHRENFSWEGAYRFDELLGFLLLIHGGEDLDGLPVSISVTSGSDSPRQWRRFSCHPLFEWMFKDVVSDFAQTNDPDRISIDVSVMSCVKEALEMLRLRSGVFRIDLGRSTRRNSLTDYLYDRFQFRFERQDGTIVIDEHLSFGQKRLLSFLFYLAANDGPVIADELVDGMHYRWVERCLELMKGRQTFLSSQSPLLMDFLGFDSAEEVQRTFIRCERVFEDGRDQMVWRNLTADEAAEFFEAWQVGIQHVSELLRDRGLW